MCSVKFSSVITANAGNERQNSDNRQNYMGIQVQLHVESGLNILSHPCTKNFCRLCLNQIIKPKYYFQTVYSDPLLLLVSNDFENVRFLTKSVT